MITRGLAQEIPFSDHSFDTVVATFPSEYIFDSLSLACIGRILNPKGKLVVLMSAWITGGSLPDRLAAGLFRVTGQVQGEPGSIPANIQKLFRQSGYVLQKEIIPLEGSKVLLLIATKGSQP